MSEKTPQKESGSGSPSRPSGVKLEVKINKIIARVDRQQRELGEILAALLEINITARQALPVRPVWTNRSGPLSQSR